MKKLLKTSLLTAVFLLTSIGFAQPVITLVNLEQTGTVEEGSTANFTLTYKTDASGADIPSNTQRLYLPGTGPVSPGFAEIIWTQTNGTETTVNLSFPWPVGFATDTYDWRFFNAGDKTDFDWAPLAEHQADLPGGSKSFGGPTFEPETDYLGLPVLITVEPVLSTKDVVNKLSVYTSDNKLNVNATHASDYRIYSITGSEVKNGSASTSIDISDLASGLYIYKSEKGFAKFVK